MEYVEKTDNNEKQKTAEWILNYFLYGSHKILSLMDILIERGLINSEFVSILLQRHLEEEIEDGEFDLPRMVDDDELLLYEEPFMDSAILTYMKFKDFYPILEKKLIAD